MQSVIEREPLRRKIEARLRTAILEGRFVPGARLIERELIEMLGVSRPSLREALRQLEAEQLIHMRPSGGPVVARVDAAEVRQIYEVRCSLEGLAARRCAVHATDAQIKAVRAAFNEFKKVAKGGTNLELVSAKSHFYRVLLEGSGNPLVERMLTQLHNRINLLRGTSMSRKGRIKETIAEVEKIVAAIERRDGPGADAATTEHLESAARAALQILEDREGA